MVSAPLSVAGSVGPAGGAGLGGAVGAAGPGGGARAGGTGARHDGEARDQRGESKLGIHRIGSSSNGLMPAPEGGWHGGDRRDEPAGDGGVGGGKRTAPPAAARSPGPPAG